MPDDAFDASMIALVKADLLSEFPEYNSPTTSAAPVPEPTSTVPDLTKIQMLYCYDQNHAQGWSGISFPNSLAQDIVDSICDEQCAVGGNCASQKVLSGQNYFIHKEIPSCGVRDCPMFGHNYLNAALGSQGGNCVFTMGTNHCKAVLQYILGSCPDVGGYAVDNCGFYLFGAGALPLNKYN